MLARTRPLPYAARIPACSQYGYPMKVLMVNTPKAPKFKGGDLRQMRETAKALATLQVTVGESFDPEPDATGFDLAHVFNIRTIDATTRQVRHLSRFGIPIVLSPVYLNVSFAHWGTEAVRDTFSTPCSHGVRGTPYITIARDRRFW